jgi:hypothetical protein
VEAYTTWSNVRFRPAEVEVWAQAVRDAFEHPEPIEDVSLYDWARLAAVTRDVLVSAARAAERTPVALGTPQGA